MKSLSALLPAVVLAVLATGCVHSGHYDGRYPGGRTVVEPGQERVLVCHKGKKTMELPASALNGHLNHGDHRGPC